MKGRSRLRWITCSLLCLLVVGTACRENVESRWKTLAVLTNSDGDCFFVRQQHYDRWEGWQVAFGFVDSSGNTHRYYLANESLPWTNVKLIETNAIIKIFRFGLQEVGNFNTTNSSFINNLNAVNYDKLSARKEGDASPDFFQLER